MFFRCDSLRYANPYVRLSALILSVRSIILGTVIVLFFKCMGALLSPTNRIGGVAKWGLVAHTGAMFTFLTVLIATSSDVQSISFIDNRAFPGADGAPWAGPLAYELFIYSKAINVAPIIMFLLNNWLADGLLASHLFNPVAQVSDICPHPALSLLCHLCHELLGHHLPIPHVPHLHLYVPTTFASKQLL